MPAHRRIETPAHLLIETFGEEVGQLQVEPPTTYRSVPALAFNRQLSNVSVLDLFRPERENRYLGEGGRMGGRTFFIFYCSFTVNFRADQEGTDRSVLTGTEKYIRKKSGGGGGE